MKKQIIGILVCSILIATVILPVSGDISTDKTIIEDEHLVDSQETVTSGNDVDWWPQFHHDLQLTGYTTSTAISADGTIYVGTQIGSVSGGDIIAINPDGTERWKKRIANDWIRSSPCIAEDGTIYIGSECEMGGYLHAFGPVETNEPPDKPAITGETNGKAGENYWYTFHVIDPDNNPISWYIEWGDGETIEWNREWASKENCYYEHTWSTQDNYTIRAKARDVLGEESDWAYLEVTMPKNKQVSNIGFLHWLDRFPILNQIVNLLMEKWI